MRGFAAAAAAALLAAAPALAAGGLEQRVGTRFHYRAAELPAPDATPSAHNGPRYRCCPEGQELRLPDGFAWNVFAPSVTHARALLVLPGGDVLVAQPNPGTILLLRDADGDGTAEEKHVFAKDFQRPHGMALRDGDLYIADVQAVWRIPYAEGDLRAAATPVRVTPPGALGEGSGHWTRNIALSPDGGEIFVAVGSRGNVGEEEAPRATIQRFAADGSGQRTFAAGLRNPVGIAFRPGTDELWTVVNERDGMGDGLVPDYLTRVAEGAFYGWPYSYVGGNPQPGLADRRPDLVGRAVVPDVLFQSHSAPIGLVFYDGAAFPEEYRGDAFVALRGSWNAGQPRGYKIVRVFFEDGRPTGAYENFATGFWFEGEETAVVWGRPAGLAVARDGSLLVADDTGQQVLRIAFRP